MRNGDDEVDDDEVGEDEEEVEVEVLCYFSFPDFDHTSFVIDAKEVLFSDITGYNPACTIDGYKFSGQQLKSLGSFLFLDSTNLTSASKSSDDCIIGMTDQFVKFDLEGIPSCEEVLASFLFRCLTIY